MSARIALPVAALAAVLAVVVALGTCTMLIVLAASRAPPSVALGGGFTGPGPGATPAAPSAEALADIPALYLELYMQAAIRYGLDWTVLAGIGRVECDHGRDPAPSCTVEGQLNFAGAGGPAQFLVSTWQRYGVSATGQGPPDMWRPADAIFSMANYLRACGAPGDYPQAVYGYNHAWWYVADVLAWAARYRAAYGAGTAPGPTPARKPRPPPR